VADERGVLAIFSRPDDVISCLHRLIDAKHPVRTVFSPIRLPEVQELLGMRPSPVRWITLLGGILGGVGLVALAVYAHLAFRFITGGKPVLPWIPWVVVCFAGVILFAVLFCVTAWVVAAGLPRLRPATSYDPRFSEDRFGVLVVPAPSNQEELVRLLREWGAEEVRDV
jgi:Protein of unknown function (DUF3341)